MANNTTTKKNAITRAQLLDEAIALFEDAEMLDYAERAKAWLAQVNKTSSKPKAPSKTQLQNAASLRELVSVMDNIAIPIGTDWVMEHMRFITSAQKASVILNLGVKSGEITKCKPDHGKARYILSKYAEDVDTEE